MRQVFADYNLSVSPEDITLDEVRFFYDPMIPSLAKIQKELERGKQVRH